MRAVLLHQLNQGVVTKCDACKWSCVLLADLYWSPTSGVQVIGKATLSKRYCEKTQADTVCLTKTCKQGTWRLVWQGHQSLKLHITCTSFTLVTGSPLTWKLNFQDCSMISSNTSRLPWFPQWVCTPIALEQVCQENPTSIYTDRPVKRFSALHIFSK